jgi:hypothetical protein
MDRDPGYVPFFGGDSVPLGFPFQHPHQRPYNKSTHHQTA